MKKSLSRIKKRTDSIWSNCERFLQSGPAGDRLNPVSEFMYSVSMEDSIRCAKGLLRSKENNPELIAEDITDNLEGTFIMSFGLGFVIGGMVELSDPEAQRAIEELRGELKKFKIFPYFPRERESGSCRLVNKENEERAEIDTSEYFLISADQIVLNEALFLTPKNRYILEINSETKNEIKPLTREKAHQWLKDYDSGSSFEKIEKIAKKWFRDQKKEKEPARERKAA